MSHYVHLVADFFVLRTPSLPFDFQEAWSAGTGASGPRPDSAGLRAQLKEAIGHPGIREALFVASADLEGSLDAWAADQLDAERSQRVEQSLIRYLTRMSSRATPFGLFAGCSVGAWGPVSQLEVPAWQKCSRRTRLDMDYLGHLLAAWEDDRELRSAQVYRPNSSLHRAAGRWHYAEARVLAGVGREYHLVALEATPHLELVLAQAAGGQSLARLTELVAEGAGVEAAEASGFLHDLVDAQVLVSGLNPPLTGREPMLALLAQLEASVQTRPLAAVLAKVQEDLQSLDAAGIGQAPDRYRAIIRALAVLPVPVEPRRLFQVDQFRPTAKVTLGPAVRQCLEEASDLLRRLTWPKPKGPLARFKEAFRQRYDGRMVSLLEALDPSAGIGFGLEGELGYAGAPLLEGLAFPSLASVPGRLLTDRDLYLMKRLLALNGAQVWDLEDRDLAALENPEPVRLPDAFSAVASLAATDAAAMAAGDFKVWMEHLHGPSGARLLGRFCHGDAELEAKVRAHLLAEEALRPELVFAEVVHQPDGRIGNILARPTLRKYEIPYLGVSGVALAQQILPEDLCLVLIGERLVLRSRRLGCEVVPRLSSAHNYSHGLPVYRLLAYLQEQESSHAGWSWAALAGLPFLPRVSRGRHVLSRARWRLEGVDLQPALTAKGTASFRAFQVLRDRLRLPRFVVLEEGDTTLWLDLDQPVRVQVLLHLVAKCDFFILVEAFPGPGELVAAGPEGRFCHELILPFLRQTAKLADGLPGPGKVDAPVALPGPPVPVRVLETRGFPPGSEWLYLKIYASESVADRILTETLRPFLAANRDGWDRWFYIRYADPEPHLRLRFHGDPAHLSGTVLPRLHQLLTPLLQAGLCWKIQLDTYEPELERYGGVQGLLLAERWFECDSEGALEQLGRVPGDAGAEQRWRNGLQSIDALLVGLGFDLAGKLGLVSRRRAAMALEFSAKGVLEVQLGGRFRSLRKDLEALLARPCVSSGAERQRAALERLRLAAEQGRLSVPLEDLASSLVHMQVNRLLRAGQRQHEFIFMDFLARLYRSQLAMHSIRSPNFTVQGKVELKINL